MTGPARVDHQTMVGSFHAHQVPLPRAKTDDEQLALLQKWLSSYDIHDLLDTRPGATTRTRTPNPGDPGELFKPEVLRILPPRVDRRLGMTKETYDGYESLDVPDFKEFVDEKADEKLSPMKAIAGKQYLFHMDTYECGVI
jgi:xylulose-5-phosphate/fructose-6-phosphate phosphoketolase